MSAATNVVVPMPPAMVSTSVGITKRRELSYTEIDPVMGSILIWWGRLGSNQLLSLDLCFTDRVSSLSLASPKWRKVRVSIPHPLREPRFSKPFKWAHLVPSLTGGKRRSRSPVP